MRLLLLLLLPLTCLAQVETDSLHGVLPQSDGQVVYQKTIDFPGLSKDDIYRRARRWWVYTYPSTDATLQLDDEKAGELIGKGYNLIVPADYPRSIDKFYTFSTMRIESMNEQMRVSISHISVTTTMDLLRKTPIETLKKSPQKSLIKTLEHIKLNLQERIQSLSNSITRNK